MVTVNRPVYVDVAEYTPVGYLEIGSSKEMCGKEGAEPVKKEITQ